MFRQRLTCALSALEWRNVMQRSVSHEVVEKEGRRHWLDVYLPRARPWLQKQNRRWWIRGIKSRCIQYSMLQDQQERIHFFIEKAYQEYYAKHEHRRTDGPSQTHLQVACLVLATHKVLLPWIRNQESLMEILSGHMGSAGAPILRALLHSTLYIRHKLFGTIPFTVLSRMMRSLRLDMGDSWTSTIKTTDSQCVVEVSSCLYNDIFQEEGQPMLSSACCCSQDKSWFEGLEYHKVHYKRLHWLGDGDRQCCLLLQKQD